MSSIPVCVCLLIATTNNNMRIICIIPYMWSYNDVCVTTTMTIYHAEVVYVEWMYVLLNEVVVVVMCVEIFRYYLGVGWGYFSLFLSWSSDPHHHFFLYAFHSLPLSLWKFETFEVFSVTKITLLKSLHILSM